MNKEKLNQNKKYIIRSQKLKEFYLNFENFDKIITDSIIEQKTLFELNSQNLMLNEIEKFFKNNMNKMYKSIYEIQINYKNEIKESTEKSKLKNQ